MNCNHKTKRGTRCNRVASYRIHCKLLCWQHAKIYNVFQKKGDKCNFKLLQKVESIRRPFVGLGVAGRQSGISGSLSVQSIFNIFKIMHQPNTTFIDIGAADGYMLIMGLLFGYKNSTGIEQMTSQTGLRNIFDSVWDALKANIGKDILQNPWSRNKPTLLYNTSIASLRSFNTLSGPGPAHVFSFWDGFSDADCVAFIRKFAAPHSVKRACFVSRRSRRFGTFDKLAHEFSKFHIHIDEIKSLPVRYGKENYNAIIVAF